MSDGTSFTLDFATTGQVGVNAMATSMDTLDKALQAAKKSSLDASAAVRAGEASYNAAQRSADGAAKAVERIGVAAQAQRGKLQAAMDVGDAKGADAAAAKLQNLVARQAEAQAKASAAASSMNAEAAALDKLKAAAGTAEAAEAKLTQEMQDAKKAQDAAAKAGGGEGDGMSFEKLERGANKLGGPLGSLIGKAAGVGSGFSKLSASLGDAAPYAIAAIGLVAVAAAVVAVGVAAIAALAKIVEFAVGLADANRTALLLAQGIAKSVAGGALLSDKIDDLTKTLPLTGEELQGMAQKLADSGLRGADLTAALDKAAVAAAKLKFGPDFAKEMLSVSEQTKVFQADLAGVFGGLKTDALMQGLQKLVALFDSNTASGRAMKAVFESVFQPLIDFLASAAPKLEGWFIKFEILVIKGMLMIKPHFTAIKLAVEGLAIGIGVVVLVVALFVAGIVMTIGVILALVGAVVLAAVWIGTKLVEGFKAAAAWIKGLDLGGLAGNLIDGLVNGIKNGATAVFNAMKGVVTGAIDGAKKLLGIASPSKVFAEIGLQTGAGMEKGVDKSAGGVKDSLESMVSPPTSKAGKGGASGAGSGAKGGLSLSNVTFQFNGVAGAAEAKEQIETLVLKLFEGDVSSFGSAVPST